MKNGQGINSEIEQLDESPSNTQISGDQLTSSENKRRKRETENHLNFSGDDIMEEVDAGNGSRRDKRYVRIYRVT